MSRFMVKLERSLKCLENKPNLNIKEEVRFSELFREKIISELNLSKDKKNIWIILTLDSYSEVKEVVETIPFQLSEEAEIWELL